MSWISPNFESDGPNLTTPKKRIKPTETSKSEQVLSSNTESPSFNWLQKYKPKKVEELAVNVKKVKELESWLQQVTSAKSVNKLLLLSGPSGCGKTTTLQILCKSLGYKILEWITPLDKPIDETDSSRFHFSSSATKLFEEYLFKSSRYNSCVTGNSTKKVVLVKDFPNVFLHNPSSFHETLENVADKLVNPVVFICSDESLSKKLFSVTLKARCQVHSIAFNPITDQRMLKHLKSILVQESKTNKEVKKLSDEALGVVCSACPGDMRSAISKLYFTSINIQSPRNSNQTPQPRTLGKFKKPKSSSVNAPTDKDKRLDFFHGIGRVLYPKRTGSLKDLRFVHSTEAVVENFLCEPTSFVSQLHENYPTKMGDVYDLSMAADRLAKSDMLSTRWQDKDIFHAYSLSVAVQGLMVSNSNPQKAKFEAFRKSQTSRLEVDSKSIEMEGKSLFSDLFILDYECLLDILPYSRLLLPDLNPGQLEYIRKTCGFSSV